MTKLSQTQRDKVERALAQHKYCKNAWFWSPPATGVGRKRTEDKHTWGVGFRHKGVDYKYTSQVRCSGKRVYYVGQFYADGKRVTIRTFKALL